MQPDFGSRGVTRPLSAFLRLAMLSGNCEQPEQTLGVRYLFRRDLTSPLLVRGPHYTHVYWLHAVYCQTLLAS